MLNNNLLPLGSVVYLQEGSIPVMVVLRRPILNIEEQSYYFDYAGVNQIIGLEPDKISYFNQENISKIVFEGYINEYEERVQQGLLKWEEKNNQVQLTIANYDNFILLTQLKFLFHLCLEYP